MATCAEALAVQALSTPAVDASTAMDVLVDALLEADILSGDTRGVGEAHTFAVLRCRAFEWARRRLCRTPNPMQLLVEIVARALDASGLPRAVVGVVRPSLIRVHFLSHVDVQVLAATHEAVAGSLPGALVVETTCRSAA